MRGWLCWMPLRMAVQRCMRMHSLLLVLGCLKGLDTLSGGCLAGSVAAASRRLAMRHEPLPSVAQ